jgi:hypothetical protein
VKNERHIEIKLISSEIIRMMSDGLGSRARKSWKGSGSGRGNFEKDSEQSEE